jgi:hypothetical protein
MDVAMFLYDYFVPLLALLYVVAMAGAVVLFQRSKRRTKARSNRIE